MVTDITANYIVYTGETWNSIFIPENLGKGKKWERKKKGETGISQSMFIHSPVTDNECI